MNNPYVERFPVGTLVRIVKRDQLEAFQSTWHLHHPLDDNQLRYAAHETRVARVGFYHGGDALYELDGVPGIWHEQHLTAAST